MNTAKRTKRARPARRDRYSIMPPSFKPPTQAQVDLAKWTLTCNFNGKFVKMPAELRKAATALLVSAFAREAQQMFGSPTISTNGSVYYSASQTTAPRNIFTSVGRSDYSGAPLGASISSATMESK